MILQVAVKKVITKTYCQLISYLKEKCFFYTLNANMADQSVVARDKLHESEVS